MLIRHLLLVATATTVTLASQQMPRFEFTSSSKIMLTWNDKWEVGGSNMLAILGDGKKIGIRVKVDGDTGGGMKRLLKYKCPMSSTDNTIDLSSLTTTPTSDLCASSISFELSALATADGDDFELKIGSSSLSYNDVFKQRVELYVTVEFSTGVLTSNTLFVWNLDAISSFSSASTSTAYTKRFLTDAAVSYLKQMPAGTDGFGSIQFLDPAISRVLKDAPDFFKAKINLGSVLYFDAASCLFYQMRKSIMFVNYNSKLDDENQKFQKLMKLNINDGKLWYSICGLRNEVKRFYDEKRPPFIGICSIVAFSGEVEPYLRTDAVQQRVPISEISYSSCTTTTKSCEVIGGTSPNVTILSGMDYTAIVCPIICDDKTEVFRFFRNDMQLVGSGDDWTYIEGGLRISRTGNIVEFPPTLSNIHSGIYRCQAGSRSFSYNVKVISLPQFQTEIFTTDTRTGTSGLLPPKVYAIEGEYLSYSCAVYFANLETVRIKPVFYSYAVTTVYGNVRWEKFSLEQFRSKVNTDVQNFFLSETSVGKDVKRLTATVLRVPPVYITRGTNFTHRFVCDVSIDGPETMKIGMQTYSVQSGGDVVFIPRPTRSQFVLNPNNSCSVQLCGFGRGAFFEFSLTDDFMAYLTSIGVEVVSFLRLDNDLLDNVKILFSNASEISSKNESQRIAYTIHPVRSAEVAKELAKRKQLTPVYNFRYKAGSIISNLKLDKERHGTPIASLGDRDCRQDPLCFYSTDFDIKSCLSFLPVALNFTMPIGTTEEITASLPPASSE